MRFLAFSFSIIVFGALLTYAPPAKAQGMSEYGGLMAMPKPMGSAQTMGGGLNKLYGAPNKALSGIGSGSGPTGSTGSGGSNRNLGTPITRTTGAKTGGGKTDILRLAAQAKDLSKQAITFEKAGKINEAELAYKKSLGIREAYWKDRDPDIPGILNALAKINVDKKNYDQAHKYINASLVVLGKLHGPGSAHRIVPAELQGRIYEEQSDYARAFESYQQCNLLLERLSTDEVSEYLPQGLADKIKEKYTELLARVTGKAPVVTEDQNLKTK